MREKVRRCEVAAWPGTKEHPGDERLIQVSWHPVRWREVRSEIAVKREPSSDGMLSLAKPTGLAHGCYLLKGTQYYVAVSARRGWQRLPQRRGEVCLAQDLDSRKEVRTGGSHSPSCSGIAGEALVAATVLEDLNHLQEEEGRSLVGCILLHQSSHS